MNLFGNRWILIPAVALSASLSASAAASGASPYGEAFEGTSGSALGNTTGRSGLGWTQPPSGEAPVVPVALSRAEEGMISFDLQRRPVPGEGDLDTVFEFIDIQDVRVFRLQVRWSYPKRGTALLINSAPTRDYFENGVALWSPVIPLNREVRPGDWVHVDLTWNDTTSEYRAFADRAPIDAKSGSIQIGTGGESVPDLRPSLNEAARALGEPPPYPPKGFGYFLERTASVAMGNHPVPDLPSGRRRALLSNSVLDNFEIRTGRLASIESVSHNALAEAGYSGNLVAGDRLTILLEAQPGGTASFDIDGIASKSPMVESPREPGTYIGSYDVKPGDFSTTGRVTGHFSSYTGFDADPVAAANPAAIDGRARLSVKTATGLLPADRAARSRVTVRADDANGRALKGRPLALILSTTDEYTGTVGAGSFEDAVGGFLEVDWGGVTDSFGEVTAQVRSGFAAKTMLISARDMVSGDVGVGSVRTFIEGTVDILVRQPEASALSFPGTLEITASRTWLTADGKSRSRITATVRDAAGAPVAGHTLAFSLTGDNGSLKVVQSRTDGSGNGYADYVAGVRMGQAVIEVRDQTSGLSGVIEIELRPDAPAEVTLLADPVEVVIGGAGATVTAKVMDVNKNASRDAVVSFAIAAGEGSLSAPWAGTDPRTGKASVTFMPGRTPGTVVVKGTVTSREPSAEEVTAAQGAVFLFGLAANPGILSVDRWLVKAGEKVVKGQGTLVLKDKKGVSYTIPSPRDGKVSFIAVEAGDEVTYGGTLGYVVP